MKQLKLWPIFIFVVGLVGWLLLTVMLVLFHLFDLASLSLGLGVTGIAISSVSISLAYRLPNVKVNFKALYLSLSVLSVGAALYLVSYAIQNIGDIRYLAYAIDVIGIAGLFFVPRRTSKL